MTRPNILWIMADELRADALSCYGTPDPRVRTPHIDRLAGTGVLFERSFSSAPVCVPARHAMLSGISPLHSGILNNEGYGPAGAAPARMFPEHLAEAGWRTANHGKEHLPGGRIPWMKHDASGSGMSELLAQAKELGSDIRRTPGIGHVISAVLPDGARLPSENISDRVIAELRSAERPFVIRASFVQPHKPMVVPEPWASRYDDVRFDIPRDPSGSGNGFEAAWALVTRGAELDDESSQTSFRQYHAAVAWLDDQVGTIMSALEDTGLLDSTIVVLGTDHGASLGEHGILAKHTFAPESHRVPLIVSWPGHLPTNERRGDLVVSEDLAPTLLALTGLPPDPQMTGRNLFGDAAPDHILSAIGYGVTSSRAFPNRDAGAWNDGRGWPQRVCVRTARYRLDATTRRAGTAVSPDDRDVFLADSLIDPTERTNLAADQRYSAVTNDLLTLVHQASANIPEPAVRPAAFALTRSGTSPA